MGKKATIQGYDPSNAKCDPEVYKKGKPICMFHAPSVPTEEWVRKVAAESGDRVDWHYVGGYAIVKFIGDREKVERAVIKLMGEMPPGAERFQMADE
jgi:hypothetical protein